MIQTLDSIHRFMHGSRALQLFTVFTRLLVGLAFIPPSIPKILHKPFTVLDPSNPVGAYFTALYNTGFYYEFIGWSQLIAAILLLIPRTSHIGAFLFLPIIANIAVLTTSVGFVGTWFITIMMTLAGTWLVAWEWDRIKAATLTKRPERTTPFRFDLVAIPLFFGVGGVMMAVLWWTIRLGNFSNYFNVGLFLVGLGLVFGLLVTFHMRFMKVGRVEHAGRELA